MAQENTASQQIYDLLVTKDFDPKSLDAMGKPTVNPSEADLFSFVFSANGNEYGTVVVLVNGDNDLEVYYGDNLGKGMDPGDKGDWYDFLAMLRQTAKRNLLTFSLNNMNKLKYQMASMADISESLIMEAWKAQGKSKSYSNQPGKAKVVIQHSRAIGEGEQRFRNIAALFVENAQGERFRMPFESIAGAKAMARHVSEGGTPYDAFGQHISETMNEIKTLGKFVRASRSNQFAQNEQALDIVEDAVKHYADLKRKAKKMIGKRGYKEIFSAYDPAETTELDETIESVREVFVNSAIDSRIEEALPILAKIKENTMREADVFENWTNQIMEGTWALPETEEDMAKLRELMSKPLPCGPDGEYASEQLYSLIGDDELFDNIGELADKDPDADCRELVKARAQELGVEIDVQESINEKRKPKIKKPDNLTTSIEEIASDGFNYDDMLDIGFLYDNIQDGLYGDDFSDYADKISKDLFAIKDLYIQATEQQADLDVPSSPSSPGVPIPAEIGQQIEALKANIKASIPNIDNAMFKFEDSINESPTQEEPASGYQAGQQRAAAGKSRSLEMGMGGQDVVKTAGGSDIEEGVDSFVNPNDQDATRSKTNVPTDDLDSEDMTEIEDIDTGKQALKAERDPMLERILYLAKG
jgi:hypothetical protein